MFILMYSMCVPSCLYCAVLWAAGVGVSNKSIINKNMFWPASSFKQVLIRPAPLNKLIRPAPLKVVNFNSVRRVLQDRCSRKGKKKNPSSTQDAYRNERSHIVLREGRYLANVEQLSLWHHIPQCPHISHFRQAQGRGFRRGVLQWWCKLQCLVETQAHDETMVKGHKRVYGYKMKHGYMGTRWETDTRWNIGIWVQDETWVHGYKIKKGTWVQDKRGLHGYKMRKRYKMKHGYMGTRWSMGTWAQDEAWVDRYKMKQG